MDTQAELEPLKCIHFISIDYANICMFICPLSEVVLYTLQYTITQLVTAKPLLIKYFDFTCLVIVVFSLACSACFAMMLFACLGRSGL